MNFGLGGDHADGPYTSALATGNCTGVVVDIKWRRRTIMDIHTLTRFFMWCTILNTGFLLFFALIFTVAGDFIHRMHGKLFPMQRETFRIVLYSFIGAYKIAVIVFNVVPWVALAIIV